MISIYARRRLINALDLTISVLAMAFGLFWLGWILFTLLAARAARLVGLPCSPR